MAIEETQEIDAGENPFNNPSVREKLNASISQGNAMAGLINRRSEMPLPQGGRKVIKVEVITVPADDDYVVCQILNDTTKITDNDLDVALPSYLRSGTGKIDNGGKPNCPYIVGDVLYVIAVDWTGVDTGDGDLKWLDINVDGRANSVTTPVVVTLASDGGVAGSDLVDCNLTYALTDMAGNELDTSITPAQWRAVKTTYTAATRGLASWDYTGATWILDVCNEAPDTAECA